MSKATGLEALHLAVAKELMRKIQNGEASASDLGVAVRFLKDNGIDCVGEQNEDIQSLAEQFDFPVDVEDMVIN